MSDEAVRKEFEAWAREQKIFSDHPSHYDPFKREDAIPDRFYYFWGITEAAWQSWQASRSAAIQECADIAKKTLLSKPFGWCGENDMRDAILALKAAQPAAGTTPRMSKPDPFWPVRPLHKGSERCEYCSFDGERQICHYFDLSEGTTPQAERQQDESWRKLPIGWWFFKDSPECQDRYSVMERTNGGCTAVCHTGWHNEQAKKDMQSIAELHNRAVAPVETPQAERPCSCKCTACVFAETEYDHGQGHCGVGPNCTMARAVAPVGTREQKSSVWTPRDSYDAMRAILDEAEWFEPIVMPIFLPDWLQERLENCCRLAAQKTGDDKREWLVDALYFKLAVDAVTSFYAEKLDNEVPPWRRG